MTNRPKKKSDRVFEWVGLEANRFSDDGGRGNRT